MKKILTFILFILLFSCNNEDDFVKRTIILEDQLGKINLLLPKSCDSFNHKKGIIISDSLKGDLFDHSYYSYFAPSTNKYPKFNITFTHQPFDITNKNILFDSLTCTQFLINNKTDPFLGYLIERKCLLINNRQFATESIGKTTNSSESKLSLIANTYVDKRLLRINITVDAIDTSNIYSQMLKILNSISID